MGDITKDLLSYLQHLPSYPFDAKVDPLFVKELIADFPNVNLLEETKAFRWYYDNDPGSKMKHVRLGLRRWIFRARARRK